MDKEDIFIGIEKILDDWDPLGILEEYKPISYKKGVIGEYSKYIKPIINVHLANQSLHDFLTNLYMHLLDNPNEQVKKEIELTSKKLIDLFAKTNQAKLRECLN
jgi:hypothetical protein